MREQIKIPETAIEAAAKALHDGDQLAHDDWDECPEEHRDWVCKEARAAVTAAFDALGMEVDDDDGHNSCYRFRSRWLAHARHEGGDK